MNNGDWRGRNIITNIFSVMGRSSIFDVGKFKVGRRGVFKVAILLHDAVQVI